MATVAASAIRSDPLPGDPSHCSTRNTAKRSVECIFSLAAAKPESGTTAAMVTSAGREERVIEAERPATRGVEAEADGHEGQDVEQVALLSEVGGSEQACLADQ